MARVLHVVEHGEDALAILFLAMLIDVGRQVDVLRVFATLQVADGGHLLARDILDDVLVAQRLKYLVEVDGAQSTLLTDERLVDVAEVGKESAIVAQEGDDESVFVVAEVLQLIEVLTLLQEANASLLVGRRVILYIARTLQNLQGRMYAHGEVVETLAEDVDVELARDAEAVACSYLVEVGEVLVDLPNLVFGREGVVDALGEFGVVAVVVEQDGLCG